MPTSKRARRGTGPDSSIHGHLSRSQNALMRKFWDSPHGYIMTPFEALDVHQTTFDSCSYRQYIEYAGTKQGKAGFRCTEFGWQIRDSWNEANPWHKKQRSTQFGTYVRTAFKALSGKFPISPAEQGKMETPRRTGRASIQLVRKSA